MAHRRTLQALLGWPRAFFVLLDVLEDCSTAERPVQKAIGVPELASSRVEVERLQHIRPVYSMLEK